MSSPTQVATINDDDNITNKEQTAVEGATDDDNDIEETLGKSSKRTKTRRALYKLARTEVHNGGIAHSLTTGGKGSFNIPSKQATHDHVLEEHGHESWRMKALHFLHNKTVQRILLSLLVLDIFILFIELFLMTEFPQCHIIEKNCISCCEVTSEEHHERFLAGDSHDDHGHGVCDDPFEDTTTVGGCDKHKWEGIHELEVILFSLTVIILSIFFVELNLEMIVLHPKVFFRQFFFALDYVVVTVSLILDITVKSLHEDRIAALMGIVVFARIWRFIRVGHGIMEVTSELTHEKYEEIVDYTLALENLVKNHPDLQLPETTKQVRKWMIEYSEEE